jgi:glycosyltransferase involved in cell wall biosynthesis
VTVASWTILTCELPPTCGGVGHYTAQVAAALVEAGDAVMIACPPQAATPAPVPGAELLLLDDSYGRSSRRELDRRLDNCRSTILVEYVPTAFGMLGANLPFCRWLLRRATRGRDDVRVMFHEPYFEFGWSPVHRSALSIVQRRMAKTLLRASRHTYISTDAWRRYLMPYQPGQVAAPMTTVPIPSGIPASQHPSAVEAHRGRLLGAPAALLLGHFGTYGNHVAPMLRRALIEILSSDRRLAALCVGAGSDAFVADLTGGAPALAGRLHASGRVASTEAADLLSACDLLLQPYPDGITTRRTSAMAGLANGRPIVSTSGPLTEEVWTRTAAVAMTDSDDAASLVGAVRRLLDDAGARTAQAARGATAYRDFFALDHTIDVLRRASEPQE